MTSATTLGQQLQCSLKFAIHIRQDNALTTDHLATKIQAHTVQYTVKCS